MQESMSHHPTRKPSFPNFSFDILLPILVLSTPQDVLSLRLCCKTLHSATRQRHVWVQLLRHACFIHRLFLPTFPFHKMGLSELEHSVMSPVRFTTFLKRVGNSLDACNARFPCVSRILPYRLPGISDPLPDLSSIYLVPGGRFLLTSSTGSVITLWDIGYNACAPIDPFPVASAVLEHAITKFEVQATGDGLGIRIFIVSIAPPFTLLEVMEIFPSSPSASFSQIASCSLPHPLMFYSLNNDRVAYHYDNYICVLDFISNKTVAWGVPLAASNFIHIYLFEDSVLLLQPRSLYTQFTLWHIPTLQPVLENRKRLHYHYGIFTLESPNQFCFPSSQSAWFRSYPDYTQHIDLIGVANNGQDGVTRYVLKHINRHGDSHLPPLVPTLTSQFLVRCDSESYDWANPNWVREFDSTRLWDGSALVLWLEDQSLVGNLSEISPSLVISPGIVDSPNSRIEDDDWPWAIGKSISIILYDTIEQRRRDAIALCPMSGRLCVASSNEIRIVDYLVPSE